MNYTSFLFLYNYRKRSVQAVQTIKTANKMKETTPRATALHTILKFPFRKEQKV